MQLISRLARAYREVVFTGSSVNLARPPLVGVTAIRRTVLPTLFATCLLAVPSTSLAQLRSEMVAAGILSPIAFVADPMVPGVFYVPSQQGLVYVIRDGIALPRP